MPGKHRKIHFGKRTIKKLRSFPSAQRSEDIDLKTRRFKHKRPHRIKRFLVWFLSGVAVVFLLLATLLKIGISGQLLTNQMQAVLSTQLHNFADIKISDARLFLDNQFHIALEAQNVRVGHMETGLEMNNVTSFKLGLSPWQLLNGKVNVRQLVIKGTRITLPQSSDDNGLWKHLPKNANGQFDIDQMQTLLFDSMDNALAIFDKQVIRRLVIEDVVLALPSKDDDTQEIYIDNLSANNQPHELVLSSRFDMGRGPVVAEGRIMRNNQRQAGALVFKVENFPTHLGAADDVSPYFADGRTNNMFFRLTGASSLIINAERGQEDQSESSFHAALTLTNGIIEIGTETGLATNIQLNLKHNAHSGKILLLPSEINIDGLLLPLEGKIDFIPLDGKEHFGDNNYPFEIVSRNGVSSPQDSPEPPMNFNAHILGALNIEAQKLVLNELVLITPSGQTSGKGSLHFNDSSPEIDFLLETSKIDIADAKQLWPANLSPGGRRWVLSHISGGEITDGSIRIALPAGFFQNGLAVKQLSGDEIRIAANINNSSTDTFSELPVLYNIKGNVLVEGQETTVKLQNGLAALANGRQVKASQGTIVIPWGPQRPVYADLDIVLDADVKTAGDILHLHPVAVWEKLPFNPEEATGDLTATLNIRFPITHDEPQGEVTWKSDVEFKNFGLTAPLHGSLISKGAGTIHVTREGAHLIANADLDNFPASLDFILPFDDSSLKRQEKTVILLDDAQRNENIPFLNTFLSGPVKVDIGANINNTRHIKADLTNVTLAFPWVGWKKGKGVEAHAEFDIPADFAKRSSYEIDNFVIRGANINLAGTIQIENKQLKSADFKAANLNRDDNISLSIKYENKAYVINAEGTAYDARSLVKNLANSGGTGPSGEKINFRANIKKIIGFNSEVLFNVIASYDSGSRENNLTLSAITGNGAAINVRLGNKFNEHYISADSADAGVLLRFMDYYDKLHGGALTVRLSGDTRTGSLNGPVTVRNFLLIDEPRLATLVANTPSSKGPNPNNPNILSSRIPFDVAFARLGKGDNYLVVDQGILRGPSVGASFQGIIYDSIGNMALTGTFMPAYGLNRIFGNVPILGQVLGNGRDGGLIGITFKIEGSVRAPVVTVNPVSAIAPGIFRQIFEFQ